MAVTINISGSKELKDALAKLDLSKHDKTINMLLRKSALPVIRGAKNKASQEIKSNRTFVITRKGTKYTILPGTIKNSIGIISTKKAAFIINVGYRFKSPYDGWFAPYVDAGTEERKSKKGASRGKIAPRNIMDGGREALPEVSVKLKKDIEKLIIKLSK